MEYERTDSTQPEAGSRPARPARAPARTSSRRRAPHAPAAKPRRSSAGRESPGAEASRRAEKVDLDQLYLSEMAGSHVLTPAQEVEIATAIVAAERAVIGALAGAPAGARALARLREGLESGAIDVRDVVLNPDQEGLDLRLLRERVSRALALACASDDPADVARAADELGEVRLDSAVLDGVAGALRESTDPRDAAGLSAFARARRDLRRSKDRLVVGNLRLVLLFARKYLGRGVPLLDLVQEGNLGLMRAADKFDHRRGFRFNTYAAWWIRQALQRALLDRTLRLPVHVADDRRRIGKMRAVFMAQHRREPNPDEISSSTGLARERIDNILSLPAQPASLDAPIGDEGDATLVDLVAGKEAAPDEAASLHALGADLASLLGALSPREQQVLRMRFGMDNTREHTLEEVGRELSLTRERIRQIERAALAKLRARSERVDLASYL